MKDAINSDHLRQWIPPPEGELPERVVTGKQRIGS